MGIEPSILFTVWFVFIGMTRLHIAGWTSLDEIKAIVEDKP